MDGKSSQVAPVSEVDSKKVSLNSASKSAGLKWGVSSRQGVDPELASLRHLALIPDGNRRWARQHNLPVAEGHRHGFISVAPKLIDRAWDLGLVAVTFWMFSSENWKRSSAEVQDLMLIYREFLDHIAPKMRRRGIKVCHIGRRDRLPEKLLADLDKLATQTKGLNQGTLALALDFGSADEIVQGVRRLLQNPQASLQLSDAELLSELEPSTKDLPPLDLLIRTSGEYRLSGFMPLRSAYAELCFVEKLFPDMTPADLDDLAKAFEKRNRRFGS